jgi:hypothetical protein
MKHMPIMGLIALLSAPVVAQEAAPPPMMVGAPQGPMLRAGTPIVLRTTTNLTTKGKHLKVGDRFPLEVSEAVTVNGYVVIPAGSSAVGEITSVRNKGMWGKSGNIETRLLYVMANDRRMRLSGSVADKGVKAGGGAIATSAIVFLPAGFFMTGTSAVIPPGTMITGILDEDVPLAFAGPAVQPMAVSAAAPAIVAVSAPVAVAPTADEKAHKPN